MKHEPQLHVAINRPIVPSQSVIDSTEERNQLWKRLTKAWQGGSNRVLTSLGSNPVSMSRKMLEEEVCREEHVVGLKSDGVRYILYLCTRRDGSPVALMIDRARNMYEVEVVAREEYFTQETILEGELVWRKPDECAFLFLVFDAIRIRGEMMTNRPFVQRIEAVEGCTRLSEELSYVQDQEELESRVGETGAICITQFASPILMKPKRFVSLSHAASVWEARAEAHHHVDGLVIHRAMTPYKNGTATQSIYKWKDRHSIDLSGPPTALHHASGPVDDGTFEGRSVVVMKSRVVVTKEGDVAEYLIYNCDANQVHLFAIRTRPDKITPNSLLVVQSTLQDFLENITPTQIADVATK